jgi:hypothetical protein
VFKGTTLAQMATGQAANDVAAFLNVTMAGASAAWRQHARMIIVWTMNAAVHADKIRRHKLAGIKAVSAVRGFECAAEVARQGWP